MSDTLLVKLLGLIAVCCLSACTDGTESKKSRGDTSAENDGTVEGGDPASDKKENGLEKAVQPENIAGLPLTDMICYEVQSTAAQIGCRILDEKGQKYNGPINNPQLVIKTVSDGKQTAGHLPAEADSEFSFYVVIGKYDSGDVLNVSVVFLNENGEPISLSSVVIHGQFVFATSKDIDFYVDGAAGKDNGICTKTAPCKTIAAAFNLVPSAISHKVRVFIKGGTYSESLSMSSRSIQANLTITGTNEQFEESGTVIIDGADPAGNLVTCLVINNSGNGTLYLKNFEFRNCGAGLRIWDSSNANLINVKANNQVRIVGNGPSREGVGLKITDSNVKLTNIEVSKNEGHGMIVMGSSVTVAGDMLISGNGFYGMNMNGSSVTFLGKEDSAKRVNTYQFLSNGYNANGVANSLAGGIYSENSEILMRASKFLFDKNAGVAVRLNRKSVLNFVNSEELTIIASENTRLFDLLDYSGVGFQSPVKVDLRALPVNYVDAFVLNRFSSIFFDYNATKYNAGEFTYSMNGTLNIRDKSGFFVNGAEAAMTYGGPGYYTFDMSTQFPPK